MYTFTRQNNFFDDFQNLLNANIVIANYFKSVLLKQITNLKNCFKNRERDKEALGWNAIAVYRNKIHWTNVKNLHKYGKDSVKRYSICHWHKQLMDTATVLPKSNPEDEDK